MQHSPTCISSLMVACMRSCSLALAPPQLRSREHVASDRAAHSCVLARRRAIGGISRRASCGLRPPLPPPWTPARNELGWSGRAKGGILWVWWMLALLAVGHSELSHPQASAQRLHPHQHGLQVQASIPHSHGRTRYAEPVVGGEVSQEIGACACDLIPLHLRALWVWSNRRPSRARRQKAQQNHPSRPTCVLDSRGVDPPCPDPAPSPHATLYMNLTSSPPTPSCVRTRWGSTSHARMHGSVTWELQGLHPRGARPGMSSSWCSRALASQHSTRGPWPGPLPGAAHPPEEEV